MKEIATILGVPVIPYTMDEAVAKLTQDTLQRKRNFVVTANAEIIMMAQDDKGRNGVGRKLSGLYRTGTGRGV